MLKRDDRISHVEIKEIGFNKERIIHRASFTGHLKLGVGALDEYTKAEMAHNLPLSMTGWESCGGNQSTPITLYTVIKVNGRTVS